MIVVAPLLALLVIAGPQDRDVCAEPAACRHVGVVRIERPDGTVSNLNVDQTLPWVVQDNILITPGESVTVRLERGAEGLVPRLVRGGSASASAPPADGEIRFDFGGFSKGQVILTVESRWSETLDYAALMVTEPGGPQRTSVCSLMPGKPVFESWQAPIRQLALWSFRPTSEPGCKTLEFPKAG